MGHHWDEYDTKGAHVQDVDVSSSLKAAREEEERKNMTKKPKMPADEFEYKVRDADAVTGWARSASLMAGHWTDEGPRGAATPAYFAVAYRVHGARRGEQLNSLGDHIAHAQLEERIAQNKKNMRLAGQKYGEYPITFRSPALPYSRFLIGHCVTASHCWSPLCAGSGIQCSHVATTMHMSLGLDALFKTRLIIRGVLIQLCHN